MPQGYKKFENPMDDGRRKIHPDLHHEIRVKNYNGVSQRQLAREYGVSRSLIGMIVNPARAEQVRKRIRETWKDYSDRKKLTIAMRNLRAKKRKMGLTYKI